VTRPARPRRHAPERRPKATADDGSAVGLAPRAVAVALLDDVLARGRALDQAFDAHREAEALAPRDRAFALNLVSTTLRRLGQIDALLAALVDRPLPAQARLARQILRIGTAQLAFLATPAHAAVGTSVALSRQVGLGGFAPLINAVLRRLAADAGPRAAALDAARLNTPDWLWAAWTAAYGADVARQIATANLCEPTLDLTACADPAALASDLGARLLPTGTLRLSATTHVPSLPGYSDGSWWVQDAAAALPVRCLGPEAGQTIVDLCAAPGGKTAQLAASGARVIAVDRSAPRMRRLTENLARLQLAAETIVADATEWRPPAPVDAVLVDAPCTATGTLRRHPDIAHIKTPADLMSLTPVQDRLLAAAVDMVRPGGVIVYCTCSLQPEEGPERVAALLAGGAPVVRAPMPAATAALAGLLTPDGDLRTLPCHLRDIGGMDGFYAARLMRR
jgi:16S rRNA (cytosine967-C5)-methyltransferase